MSWNNQYQQPQYPPYQGAPPQPYQQQQQYGQQQQQPPYGGGGYNQPPPQAYNSYQAPPPNQYGGGGQYGAPPPIPPPPQHGGYGQQPLPPQQQQYGYPTPPPSGGFGGPQQGFQQQATPQQQFGAPPPMGGGQLWFLGVQISPLDGMNMGMPLPPPPGYDANFDSERVRKATKGFGTDESTLINTLAPLNSLQMTAVSRQFESTTGKSLVTTIEKETRGNLEWGLRGLVLGPLGFDAWLVNRACAGFGTHEDLLTEIVMGRTNAEIHLLKAAYHAMYRKDLVQTIKGELSAKTERMFLMALMGNRDESTFVNQQAVHQDVEALFRAGPGKIGTDEIGVCGILLNRSQPHLAAIAQAYPHRHHHPLSRMISQEFSGHMKDALLYIVEAAEGDGRGVDRDAEMLERSMAGMGTKDERMMWRIIRAHWERPRFEAIKASYQRKYGNSLQGRVKGETTGDYEKLMLAIIQ